MDQLGHDEATGAIGTHPLVMAAVGVAERTLAPRAAEVDAGLVPRSHLDALAAVGLLGLTAPTRVGGADAPGGVVRRVHEVLAGADLATWFVWVQHHSPVRALDLAGRFDPLLTELAAGRQLGGVAVSHLRRTPDRPVRAERDGDGWRLDGTVPWYTGWGVNDVALVAGVSGADEVVLGLVPARPGPGVTAGPLLDVAALRAAATVTLTLTGLRLPADRVVSVEPLARWLAADRARTADAQPAVFGLADSALRLLRRRGLERHEPAAVTAAERLARALDSVRARAYRLMDDVPPGERAAERLALRARAQRLLTEATTALVISGAGGSMVASAPAQRKAREALFLLVQAQTADTGREALRLWGDGADDRTG